MTHAHGPLPEMRPPANRRQPDAQAQSEHGHSMWWMVVCCAPMVVLALALLLAALGPR